MFFDVACLGELFIHIHLTIHHLQAVDAFEEEDAELGDICWDDESFDEIEEVNDEQENVLDNNDTKDDDSDSDIPIMRSDTTRSTRLVLLS